VTQVSEVPSPGRLALAWRRWRARRRGAVLGRGVVLGAGVRVEGRGLRVGDRAIIGDGCRFHLAGGTVTVGDGAVLGPRCAIVSHTSVDVGAGAVLGDEAVLLDTTHAVLLDPQPSSMAGRGTTNVQLPAIDASGGPGARGEAREARRATRAAPVVVGAGARLGPGVVVGGGTRIPDAARLDAHAVA
jgi:acetyltransferase-like isoleucine patch superfamily enzyme